MGYTVCTISHLVIERGAAVRAVFLSSADKSAGRHAPVYSPASWYTPISAAIKATFDDFAKIEDIEPTECLNFFMQQYFPNDEIQAVADSAVKHNQTVALNSNKENTSKLAVAYIHEDVYQSLLNITHEGKMRNFDKETAEQFEILKTLCALNQNQLLRMGEMKAMNLSIILRISKENIQKDENISHILSLFQMAGGDDAQMAQMKQKEALVDALLEGREQEAKSMFTDLMALHHVHAMMHVLNRTWQPANAVAEEKFTQAHAVFNEAVSKIAKGRSRPAVPRQQPKP